MKTKELAKLGVPASAMKVAIAACVEAGQFGMKRKDIRVTVESVIARPGEYEADPIFGSLAEALQEAEDAQQSYQERGEAAPWKQWGSDIEQGAIDQMVNACRLPVSVRGALMPDAHPGYGLPIGGVLATDNAVIPYAVGMDIACRMRMSVLDLPPSALKGQAGRLSRALEDETRFGVGAKFSGTLRQHRVMDEDWSFSPVLRKQKDSAWAQLGSSGSGNHFVEYGILTVHDASLGLEAGEYLALLSHSGSRGTGAEVARHYSKVARDLHQELPKQLAHLAWLDLDTEPGQEYWAAMELMGRYAAANHELIHRYVAKHLGAGVLLTVENHHNFAWREAHDGREVIVHRKGATPAGAEARGIIPGSMGTPGYVVQGRGDESSLNSASHGAGRKMSRKAAKARFTWSELKRFLEQRGVTLLSADLDEVPMAYKDIDDVMAAQHDLVRPLAKFDPKLVKMAPAGRAGRGYKGKRNRSGKGRQG